MLKPKHTVNTHTNTHICGVLSMSFAGLGGFSSLIGVFSDLRADTLKKSFSRSVRVCGREKEGQRKSVCSLFLRSLENYCFTLPVFLILSIK